MLTSPASTRSTRLYGLLLLLLILLGAALRLLQYPKIPPGFNQDEASSLYEAYCLAETGMDRWGNFLPPYFPSWGSGQNVLLSYLSVPVVKALGLSVFSARLVPVVLGILTLPLLALGLRPLGRFPAALGVFILAIVPWHFMLSRWALESNLAPFFMLLGCVLVARGLSTGRRRWILPSLVPFALALYAYGTTVLVLPVLGLGLLLTYWPQFTSRRGAWLWAAAGFALVAFPFGIFFLENQVLGRNLAWADGLFFSTPLLPANRLDQLGGGALKGNLVFLISGFQDGSNYNLLPGFPLLLLFTLPLALVGLAAAVLARFGAGRAGRQTTPARVVVNVFMFWALASLPMLALFALNVNRFNHFYLPAIVLAVWAIDQLITRVQMPVAKPLVRGLLVGWLLLEGGVAVQNYFSSYRKSSIREGFNVGLDEAFAAAQRLPVQQIRITDKMPLPYVYTLFYTQYPPREFQQHANYQLNGGVYQVNRFGPYVFYNEYLTPGQPYGYLMRKGELTGDTPTRQVVFANEAWEVGIARP